MPQIAAYLEQCFSITDKDNKLGTVQNILVGGVSAIDYNRDESNNNDEIELLDLAETLLEKLEEFHKSPNK